MQKIDIKELFKRLVQLEYDLLKYINKLQGSESKPLDFEKAAGALNVSKDDVRRACKSLVNAGVLIAEGENFGINEEIYKSEN